MWNDECNNDKKEIWDRKKEKIMEDRLFECVLECIIRIPVEIDISEILINWVKGILYVGKEKSERTRMKVANISFDLSSGK